MNKGTKALFYHFFALVFFVVASLAYFYPVLQGKTIIQSDIIQYTGMAKEQNDFRKYTDEEPYWTNSAFGGMPTYQLGAYYPHDYVRKLDRTIRFLPRPADYLFLYFIGFYILLCCLKVDYRLAVFGALAFGFFYLSHYYPWRGSQCKGTCYRLSTTSLRGHYTNFQEKVFLGIYSYRYSNGIGDRCKSFPDDLLFYVACTCSGDCIFD